MPRSPGPAKPPSPRAALQAIAVQIADAESDDFYGWLRRATAAGGGDREPLVKFATWYPAVAQCWFDAATASGVSDGGRDPGRSGRDYCRRASASLSHAERSDGVAVHFTGEAAARPLRSATCLVGEGDPAGEGVTGRRPVDEGPQEVQCCVHVLAGDGVDPCVHGVFDGRYFD